MATQKCLQHKEPTLQIPIVIYAISQRDVLTAMSVILGEGAKVVSVVNMGDFISVFGVAEEEFQAQNVKMEAESKKMEVTI